MMLTYNYIDWWWFGIDERGLANMKSPYSTTTQLIMFHVRWLTRIEEILDAKVYNQVEIRGSIGASGS